MATEKIRVGIIGANMRSGWGRDAHIPALRALPEFEITAVSTSRQETADETAKHFGSRSQTPDLYRAAQASEAEKFRHLTVSTVFDDKNLADLDRLCATANGRVDS